MRKSACVAIVFSILSLMATELNDLGPYAAGTSDDFWDTSGHSGVSVAQASATFDNGLMALAVAVGMSSECEIEVDGIASGFAISTISTFAPGLKIIFR